MYHYTSLDNVKKIIDSQEIWLTRIDCLNDISEYYHGVDCLLNETPKFQKMVLQRRTDEKTRNVLEALGSLITSLNDSNFPLTEYCFVSSFSMKNNYLPQYRNYGVCAIEFSLGFKVDAARCFYKKFEKKHEVQKLLNELYVAIFKNYDQLFTQAGLFKPHNSNVLEEHLIKLIRLVTRLKSKHYKDEYELRLFCYQREDILLRSDGTPYIAVECLPEFITNIFVGPCSSQETEIKELESFLKEKQLNNIEVVRSEIPYR